MQDSEKVGKLFTKTGTDVWRCVSYCAEPTIVYQNLETGERCGGAVHSRNVRDFQLLTTKKGSQHE